MKQWFLNKRNIVLLLCMLGCLVLIWPIGVLKDTKISRTEADYSRDTGPIGEVAAIQQFIPQYDEIKSVGVDIGKLQGKANQGTLYLNFYDVNLNLFARFPQEISTMNDGTLTDITTNLKVKKGETYFLSVQCEDCGDTPPVLHYRSKAGNGPVENQYFYYGPTVIEDASANIRYIYNISLNVGQILFYDSFILLFFATILCLMDRKKKDSNVDERNDTNRR